MTICTFDIPSGDVTDEEACAVVDTLATLLATSDQCQFQYALSELDTLQFHQCQALAMKAAGALAEFCYERHHRLGLHRGYSFELLMESDTL